MLLFLKDELEDNQLDDSQLDDNELDDNFLGVPELGDNQPLRAWQRSAIQLKPRKKFKRYTPSVNERKARKKEANGCLHHLQLQPIVCPCTAPSRRCHRRL